jgi:hypothetical protein
VDAFDECAHAWIVLASRMPANALTVYRILG